jgi:hypothetical protein
VAIVVGVALASGVLAQQAASPQKPEIPAGATVLEGVPAVRIDTSQAGATRQVLTPPEAAKERLRVRIVDGRYYWESRGNRLLSLAPSGEFTYLSSAPGAYIRITRLNDRLAYVEHVDSPTGSITWWGELRVVLGK